MQVKDMKTFIIENIKPTNLLGGYSARDGLNTSDLIEWSKDLGLTSNKTKDQLIAQIIEYYDNYQEIEVDSDDPRALYFEYYELLAARKLEELRAKGIIHKDLDCERMFEKSNSLYFLKRYSMFSQFNKSKEMNIQMVCWLLMINSSCGIINQKKPT